MDERQLSPGFKFHPTDVELVMYYLKRKLLGMKFHSDVIREVDIYKFDPWDLPYQSGRETDNRWYFFCTKTPKYAMGPRINRSTTMGYWKATGKDRVVSYNQRLVGMIKTLVFHKGRPPNGERTHWVMREYRLEYELADKVLDQNAYVLCVLCKKDGPGPRKSEYGVPFREEDWNFEGAGFEPSGSVSIEGDSVASRFFQTPHSPCSLLTDMSDTVTTGSDPGLIMHEDDFSGMVDIVDFPILDDLSGKEKIKGMEERERRSFINELLMGQGLVRQLQTHLNSTSSSTENTQGMLVQRILDSYREVLSMLNSRSLSGQMEVPSYTGAGEMSELHTSTSATPQSEVDDLEFENKEIKTDGFERKKIIRPRWTVKVQTSTEVVPFEDGYSWRKYGQKDILGAKYPRSYYRCNYRNLQNCWATKQVQRSDDDPMLFEVTYRGRHTCNPPINSPSDLLRPPSPLHFSQVSNTVEPHHCQKHDQQDELHPQELAFDFFTGRQRSSEDLLTHQEMNNSVDIGVEEFESVCNYVFDYEDNTLMRKGSVSETCSLVSNDQISHPLLHMLESQHCATNPIIRSSFASGSSPACHVSDVREEVVHCTKQDLDVSDAHTSLGSSVAKLQGQYLKKLINLLFDIYPSKSWTTNLRAEWLVELNLSCRNGPQLQELVNLTHLDLSNSNFTTLPDLSRSNKLQNLNLKGCGNLVGVSCIKCLSKLEYLNMEGCTSLKCLPSVRAMKSLVSVNLSGCTHLKRLPLSIGGLSSLTNLNLRNCKRIQNLPISTSRLKTLQGFNISGCLNLLKHMNNGGSQEMSSSVDPRLPDPSYSPSIISNHQMDLSNSFISDGMKDINSIDRQLVHSPSTSVSEVPAQEDAMLLDPLIGEHFRQFEEEGNTNSSDSVKKTSHKRKTSCEMIQYQPTTSRPSLKSHDADLTLAQPLLQQQQKGLLDYMSMPVEAIHEVDVFDDVERIVETLIQQSSDLHEISNLEDVLSYLGELQESIPDTLPRMHIAQSYRTSFQVKLAHLDVSLVQAQEELGSLENKLAMLSEEEDKLDAEILCLMAKKEKLLNEKSSNDSI